MPALEDRLAEFVEEEVQPGHIAIASMWLRDDIHSRKYVKGDFFLDLRQWLYTHPNLTRRQAVYVLNLMLRTQQWEPYIKHIRNIKAQAGAVSKSCVLVEAGTAHEQHAWNLDGVTLLCTGLAPRPVKRTEAKLSRHRLIYNEKSCKLHVIERAWYEWQPLPDRWGFYDPDYRIQLPCRILTSLDGHQLIKDVPAADQLTQGRLTWCKSCLNLAGHKYNLPVIGRRRSIHAPQCKASGMSRTEDRTLECHYVANHPKKHKDPSTGIAWTDRDVVRIS